MGEMAKVLVLKRRPDGGHVGFWTEFEGEKSLPLAAVVAVLILSFGS